MAKQNINIGSSANDGSGDSLRDAAVKINQNFTELYATSGLDTTFTQAAFNAANSAITMIQNPQSSNYVLSLTDAGKYLYYTQSANVTLYIPNSSSVAFSNGTTITIISKTSSSANITISPNTGVSLYFAANSTSSSRNVITYGTATILMASSNTWYVNGFGVS
jgi:hypothetical protein